ncbi:ammonia-forming cytochrome c nitrite reductase subunit c552 [Anaerobacillus sp. HL2]|nr:ammonia-forming cytochrome c nitrite reductase subunit c552 [Anaerobacillus sp. HL2]
MVKTFQMLQQTKCVHVCAQCHVEYYFYWQMIKVTFPWTSISMKEMYRVLQRCSNWWIHLTGHTLYQVHQC